MNYQKKSCRFSSAKYFIFFSICSDQRDLTEIVGPFGGLLQSCLVKQTVLEEPRPPPKVQHEKAFMPRCSAPIPIFLWMCVASVVTVH